MVDVNDAIPAWAAKGAAAALAVGYAGATLCPWHFLPTPSFFQEAFAGAMALFAVLLLISGGALRRGLVLPWSTLAALALAAVAVLQLKFRAPLYADRILWLLGSLAVAIGSAWIGHMVQRQRRAEQLFGVIASGFALVGVATALVVWLQLVQPGHQTWWLFPRMPLQPPSGNLGQRNQAALVLGFGLLAIAYETRFGLPIWRRIPGALAALLCVSAIALTQSRIAFAFLAVAGAAAGALWVPPRRRLYGAVAGALFVLLLDIAAQYCIYKGFGLGQLFPPATQRLADRGVGQRIGMLHVAWTEWRAHPWWGGGFSTFANWEYRLGLQQSQPLFSTNAHNVFAQIGAEFGLIGLGAVLVPAAIGIFRAGRQCVRVGMAGFEDWRWFALAVCAMLGGYSLTEYPLWYVQFLAVFALCWGAMDESALTARISRSLVVLLVCGNLAMLAALGWASTRYLAIVKLTAFATDRSLFAHNRLAYEKALQRLIGSPGFTQEIDMLTFVGVPIGPVMLQQKIDLGERVASEYTGSYVLEKLARLEALARKPGASADALARACAYAPQDCPGVRADMAALGRQDPAIFGPVMSAFDAMPQSKLSAGDANVLRPWEAGAKGTVVTINPSATWFGIDLAPVAAGIKGRAGSFIAAPATRAPAPAPKAP